MKQIVYTSHVYSSNFSRTRVIVEYSVHGCDEIGCGAAETRGWRRARCGSGEWCSVQRSNNNLEIDKATQSKVCGEGGGEG